MGRRYRDERWLREQYHSRGLTQREIAEECGVSPRTIRKYMKRFGIETREVKGKNHGLYGKERSDEVKRKISEKLSGREFSEESLRRMSEAHTGQSLPEEVREKISNSLKGIPKSDETRRRMRRAKMGEDGNWEYAHWLRSAYGPGLHIAKREVHLRDEVCQICRHDGSEHDLEVHHLVPVRLFRESEHLEFRDAHCLENLLLVCRTCHPKVEWGEIDIEPDFESIPEEKRGEFRKLWNLYIRQKREGDSG